MFSFSKSRDLFGGTVLLTQSGLVKLLEASYFDILDRTTSFSGVLALYFVKLQKKDKTRWFLHSMLVLWILPSKETLKPFRQKEREKERESETYSSEIIRTIKATVKRIFKAHQGSPSGTHKWHMVSYLNDNIKHAGNVQYALTRSFANFRRNSRNGIQNTCCWKH